MAEPRDTNPSDAPPRVPAIAIATLFAALLLAHRPLLRWEAFDPVYVDEGEGQIFFDPTTTPPALVLLVIGWILFRRRKAILRACVTGRTDLRADLLGGLLLATSFALSSIAFGAPAPDLSMPALALALPGLALVLGGFSAGSALVVPALLLTIASPPPGVALNAVTWPLQLLTADFSSSLLDVFGVDHGRQLDLLFYGDYVFQVIESCAGLRAIQSLLLAALVLGEALDAPPIRRAALVLVAVPLAIGINVLRVVWIVLVTQETSHFTQGLVAIVSGVLVLGAIDALIARRAPDAHPTDAGDPVVIVRATRRFVALAALQVAIGLATVGIAHHRDDTPAPRRPFGLATAYGEWSGTGSRADFGFLGSAGADRVISLDLRREDQRAHLVAFFDDRRARTRSALTGKTLPFETGAFVVSARSFDDPERGRVDVLAFRSWIDGRYRLVHHWRTGFASAPIEAARSWLAIDRVRGGRREVASVVRLSLDVSPERPSEDDWAEADATLRALGALVEPAVAAGRARLQPAD